jgi:hypothetical protein
MFRHIPLVDNAFLPLNGLLPLFVPMRRSPSHYWRKYIARREAGADAVVFSATYVCVEAFLQPDVALRFA